MRIPSLMWSYVVLSANFFQGSHHIQDLVVEPIFIFYHENVCRVYSLELPHRGNSNEYTQYTIIL